MENTCLFSLLPSDLTMIIITKLPTKQIVHCKLVCKEWRDLIEDPILYRLRSQSVHKSLLFKPFHHDYFESMFLKLDTNFDEPAANDPRIMQCDGIFWLDNPRYWNHYNKPSVLNECNGLVCSGHGTPSTPYRICNPMIKYSCIFIGNGHIGRDYYYGCSCFGYSPKINRYKFMRILPRRGKGYEGERFKLPRFVVEVYTIGTETREWRVIGEEAPAGILTHRASPVFLNAAGHWVDGDRVVDFITSFDFDREQFGVVPTPRGLGNVKLYRGDVYHIGLGVMGNNLLSMTHTTVTYPKFNTSVWVMKEYGVRESWQKLSEIEDKRFSICRAIMWFDSNEILIEGRVEGLLSTALYCHDPKTRISREVKIHAWHGLTEIMSCTPSFISELIEYSAFI